MRLILLALFTTSCITIYDNDDDDDEEWGDNEWIGDGNGSDDNFSVDEGSSDDDGGYDAGGGSDDGGDDGSDYGGSIDLDAAWAAPGCDYTGIVCMALTGAAFGGAPLADICAQFDEGYSDQLGGIASTPVDGCPQDGATGACELGLAEGQEQVWFSWPTLDGAANCNANGGTYVAL